MEWRELKRARVTLHRYITIVGDEGRARPVGGRIYFADQTALTSPSARPWGGSGASRPAGREHKSGHVTKHARFRFSATDYLSLLRLTSRYMRYVTPSAAIAAIISKKSVIIETCVKISVNISRLLSKVMSNFESEVWNLGPYATDQQGLSGPCRPLASTGQPFRINQQTFY